MYDFKEKLAKNLNSYLDWDVWNIIRLNIDLCYLYQGWEKLCCS